MFVAACNGGAGGGGANQGGAAGSSKAPPDLAVGSKGGSDTKGSEAGAGATGGTVVSPVGGGGMAGGGGEASGGAGEAGGDSGGAMGGGGSATTGDAAVSPPTDAPVAGGPVVVQAFKAANVYFTPTDNHRMVLGSADFPSAGEWSKVDLKIVLSCPSNRCDAYDRWGWLGIPHGEPKDETGTEIARFVTPYGRGAEWHEDVTDLVPLLKGKLALAVLIDTWVGPGNPGGNGWLVDATFTFTPGKPARAAKAVIPIWDVAHFDVGDPAKPAKPTVAAKPAAIPADATGVAIRGLITGHGQGNLQNCAEFCPKTHSYLVGGMEFKNRIWRDDCATTAVKPQPGGAAPFAARAGWCPGALVVPWTVDVSAVAKPGATVTVDYAVEAYENTCRPGAPVCKGCAFSPNCAYDDGLHTSPNYVQSAMVIVY